MNSPKYIYKSEDQLRIYEFISEGPKGIIKKMVAYTFTGTENIYNLGFGDYNEETKRIDDKSITNNNDSLKVLAQSLQQFMLLQKSIQTLQFLQQEAQV